jgi:alpha-tubulin suppressor-like RCC1 family protein
MTPPTHLELLMRRSILHAAAVASLFAQVLTGCSGDNTTTGPLPEASRNIVLGPLPPRPPLPNPNDFVDITAGANHTCARKNNNTVYCWGINDNGQDGIISRQTCANNGVPCINRPTILNTTTPEGGRGTLTSVKIDAGSNHTCIIDTLNDAYCWGDGNSGQVGFAVGSYGPIFEATKVVGGLKFALISAGSQSTCGSGPSGVFCWGRFANYAASPVAVSGYNASVNLSVGDLHACIMDGSGSGGIQCWGSNAYGQLSLPLTTPSAFFVALATYSGPSTNVVTQANFTCTNERSGIVECAGENTWGTLGNNQSGTSTSTGTPQAVGNGMLLHGVTTGSVHACALDAGGLAYCWGNGYNGQLGNNASGVYASPQAVTGGHIYRAIAAGGQHTCAIGTDNHIYCWGQNQYGQLGTQYPGGWVMNPVQALDPVL